MTSERRDETAGRLAALGVNGPLYKPFPCVLAGHVHRARVHFTKAGYWLYYCEGLTHAVGLAEIRAFLGYGREQHISPVEAARWKELLDFEAGIRWPVPIELELLEPCPDAVLRLASAMRNFVGLRDKRFPRSERFPFTDLFASAYTGLTADEVRRAKDWLERAGVIYRAGKHGHAILWKLVAQDKLSESSPRQGS